jgi:hypothetical protein
MKKCILLASIFAVATVYADTSENNLKNSNYKYSDIYTTVVLYNHTPRIVSVNLYAENVTT